MRLFRFAGAAAALAAIAGVDLLLVADPLRPARAAFQKWYGKKAFVLLVPGELVDAKVDGHWLTLGADAPVLGDVPDLLERAADESASPFTRRKAGEHGVMVGTWHVLWMWDASDKGAWKGWALVLVIERDELEDVRRGLTPRPSQP